MLRSAANHEQGVFNYDSNTKAPGKVFLSPLLVKCLGKATGINRFFADKLTAKVKHLNESGVSNDDYEDKNLI